MMTHTDLSRTPVEEAVQSSDPARLRLISVTVAVAALSLVTACSASPEEPASSEEGPGAAQTRTIDHARGETPVPDDPERIVVLEPVQLDTAVALGRAPVGAAVLDESTGAPEYLGDDVADLTTVGTVPEPDVERIAALEPDVILGTESRHSAIYDRLSDIAPTIFMETQADPWEENVKLIAETLGDAQGGRDLLADYRDRCEEIADEHDTAGETAQLIRPRDARLTLYGPISFAGSTLECAGFTIPDHDWEDISLDISPENVRSGTADLVLVTSIDAEDPTTMPEAVTQNSDAFEDVHLVDQSFWITGVGPLGGQVVLDDLDAILSER
ncbi:ABC transporter substrate-binding protein [Nesterenkonia xinjiangensis]|uniref:Iron complex transport system substrate-binding protein n=1 Tax=Nesterenkonia xinjiangensis TaxID=225327 RepID=A0A7Z0GKV8_9MICC|nr:iron-siderophore ABC transporter substrate-binding protein [Nesterenkonia xinjiangensis]NYJ77304.1 iron complex transport system substrate-binding protein [Nesterenkonia xinjiangensis]